MKDTNPIQQANPFGYRSPVGESVTLAYNDASDDAPPIPVRIGQVDEGAKTLTAEEFRKASREQKKRDAEIERQTQAKKQALLSPDNEELESRVASRRRSRRSKAPSTTSAPKRSAPRVQTNKPTTEERLDQLENTLHRFIDVVSRQIATANAPTSPGPATYSATDALNQCQQPTLRYVDSDCDPEPDEFEVSEKDAQLLADELDEQNDPVYSQATVNQALVDFIKHKDPVKTFRRELASLSPRFAFQEWPEQAQEYFTALMNCLVTHPLFLEKLQDAALTFRNGQVIGTEILGRMAIRIAGYCSLYKALCDNE